MWRSGLLVLAACGFQAGAGSDAPITGDDDAPTDSSQVTQRVTIGLLGAWTFDETSGTTVHDSGSEHVDLVANTEVTWTGTTMVVMQGSTPTLVSSPLAPLFNAQCQSNRGVTLEAWVSPAMLMQGSPTQPAVVAGLDATTATRNVSLLQAGDHWLGRVRTSPTDPNATNGFPELVPDMTHKVETKMTHLVVVADSTVRALYVNGHVVAQTAPEAPLGWDASYKMVLANELATSRLWLGTFALVALYSRALSADEIGQNYAAGPSATP